MTDQTRTGTYGSWYNYYLCGFSGRIMLPGDLGTIPGCSRCSKRSSKLNFNSTPSLNSAARRRGARPDEALHRGQRSSAWARSPSS